MPAVNQDPTTWEEEFYKYSLPYCNTSQGVDGPDEIEFYSKDLAFELWTHKPPCRGDVNLSGNITPSDLTALVNLLDANKVLIEVKNVTLCCAPETACFPDAVTVRGQKHLRELMTAVDQGYRGIILFLVQRGEAQAFSPASQIDPDYARLLCEAVNCGVESLAIQTAVTPESVKLARELPVVLS